MANNKSQLVVAAIENGTVIDHIPAEKTYQVVNLLQLEKMDTPVTIGYNLPSKKIGKKGIIKVANKYFTDVRRNDRESVDFLIGKILVGNLDDALLADLLGRQVVADGNRSVHLLQLEQIHYLIGFLGWYMVDYGTVLDSRNY